MQSALLERCAFRTSRKSGSSPRITVRLALETRCRDARLDLAMLTTLALFSAVTITCRHHCHIVSSQQYKRCISPSESKASKLRAGRPSWTSTMTDASTNYVGAGVFWMYITAALVLTGIILQTLYRLQATRASQQDLPRQPTWLFATLALASFGTLSYNMLQVLIQSFILWSHGQHSPQLLRYPTAIWQWSISSSLFQDFGEAIVANTARFLWVQSALLATLSICFYMGIEGRRHNVPRLWAFFALSQILPISFAQNLFYLALLLSDSPAQPKRVPKFWSVANIAVYCSLLANAQLASGTQYLISLILAARVVLFTPLFLAEEEDGTSPVDKENPEAWISGEGVQRIVTLVSLLMTGLKVAQTWQEGLSMDKVLSALFSHPAVASLGCDFLFSIVSFLAWINLRTREPKQDKAAERDVKRR